MCRRSRGHCPLRFRLGTQYTLFSTFELHMLRSFINKLLQAFHNRFFCLKNLYNTDQLFFCIKNQKNCTACILALIIGHLTGVKKEGGLVWSKNSSQVGLYTYSMYCIVLAKHIQDGWLWNFYLVFLVTKFLTLNLYSSLPLTLQDALPEHTLVKL